MKKILLSAGVMTMLFLMPAAVLAKKADAPGQLKKQAEAQSATAWAQNKGNCGENNPQTGSAFQLSMENLNSSQSSQSQGCGNSGAIWTVNSPDVEQDVNHYLRGESVYLNGANLPCGSIDYAIWTNPPNPQNGIMVASGTINLINGEIDDILIWTIPLDAASGVYKVQVTSCCGVKHDNFSIKKVKITEEPCQPCGGNGEGGEVAGEKEIATSLPTAGPGIGLAVLTSLVALIVSPKIRNHLLAELKN